MNGENPQLNDEELVIDLREIFYLLLSRWYLIIGLVVVAVLAAGVFTYTEDPVYESSARIIIEDQSRMIQIDGENFAAPDLADVDIDSQIEIIQSPLIINRARDYLQEEDEAELADSLESSLERGAASEVVDVSEVGGTNILRISASSSSPEHAQKTVEAVTTAFRNYREEQAERHSRRVHEFLEEQVAQAEEDVEEAERELRDFQRQEGVISLDEESSKLSERLSELETRMINIEISQQEKQLRLQQVERELDELSAELAEDSVVVTENLLENLREQLSELEAERIDYINRGLDPDSPEVASLDERIASLERSIQELTDEMVAAPENAGQGLEYYNELLAERSSLEAELAGLENELEIVNERIEENEQELVELSDQGYTMSRLERNVEIAQNTYSLLSEELERSRIALQEDVGDVSIVEEPQTPSSPISPRPMLNLSIAGVLGMMGGVGLTMGLEFFDDTVKKEDELKQLTDLPVLGVIPEIEDGDQDEVEY